MTKIPQLPDLGIPEPVVAAIEKITRVDADIPDRLADLDALRRVKDVLSRKKDYIQGLNIAVGAGIEAYLAEFQGLLDTLIEHEVSLATETKETVMPVIGWKVRYIDGTLYTSRETAWADLPRDGVCQLSIYWEDKHQWVGGADWYGYDGNDLFVWNSDTAEHNAERYPDLIFLQGKWTDRDTYKRLQQDAIDDTEPP